MRSTGLVLAALVLTAPPVLASGDRPAVEVWPRVEHHVREADHLVAHFRTVIAGECPRFESTGEWRSYLDGEIERVVLLVAHVEQAWVEAKTTGDDEVRRAAKAPRRRFLEARRLVDKLQGCAPDGGTLDPGSVWQRVESEVPARQAEIALPAP